MKTFDSKKSILTIICLLAIFAGIGAVYSIAKEEKGITKFLNGPTPSITNAFIDKENTIITTTGYIDPLNGDWYAINC